MGNKRDILFADRFYHIYNHAVGNENLFNNKSDYIQFLEKYQKHASLYFQIYSYCLMPNHFHFLIKVKSLEELIKQGYNENENIHNFLSQKIGNFFNSYTKSYNLTYNRKGRLFIESFHRIAIDTVNYLCKLIIYIHRNPVNHGFANKPNEWHYSSFNNIYKNMKNIQEYEDVIRWFDDKENYLFCHLKESDLEDEYKLEFE